MRYPRSIASLVALAAAVLSASPAFALHEIPMTGAGGDKGAHVECPAGQSMVGFSGRRGVWVNAIQVVCAPINGQPVAVGPRYGGAGGGDVDNFCQKGWRLGGSLVMFMTTLVKQVAGINYTCQSRQTGETRDAVFGNPSYIARCPGIGVGSCDDNSIVFQSCQSDEEPVGFNVNYGKDVNAFGLICGRATGTR